MARTKRSTTRRSWESSWMYVSMYILYLKLSHSRSRPWSLAIQSACFPREGAAFTHRSLLSRREVCGFFHAIDFPVFLNNLSCSNRIGRPFEESRRPGFRDIHPYLLDHVYTSPALSLRRPYHISRANEVHGPGKFMLSSTRGLKLCAHECETGPSRTARSR
jgi:hypothetical protein